MNSKIEELIRYYPILKNEEKDRINISISGKQFIIKKSQINIYPETLLGNEEKRKKFYDKKLNIYKFNRHPAIFESILYYYLNPGILIRPSNIEPEIFYEELQFWNIDSDHLEIFIEEDMIPLDNIRLLPSETWRCILWKILTYPHSIDFPYGELFIGISILITLISCLPYMSEIIPTVTELNKLQLILDVKQIYFPLYMRTSYIIEIISIIIFSIELILRIISTPIISLIFYDIFNYLDFIIILSGSICLINYHLHNIYYLNNFLSFYYYLLIFKSFRIYRLGRYMSNIRLLYKSLALSLNEIISLIISITFSMLLFGILIYMIENSELESNTRNILDGFWLAFITLTTLGYGDIYPRSFEGRFITGICAIIGIIIFSMPTMIIFVKYTRLLQNQWKYNRNIRYTYLNQKIN